MIDGSAVVLLFEIFTSNLAIASHGFNKLLLGSMSNVSCLLSHHFTVNTDFTIHGLTFVSIGVRQSPGNKSLQGEISRQQRQAVHSRVFTHE